MSRGYYGIGIYQPKRAENVGTLWRSAHAMGAAFIFTIGPRYKPQASDTSKALKHVPMFEYDTWDAFNQNRPRDCQVVCVEQTARSQPLEHYGHFERAIYVLGSEDSGIPLTICERYPVIEVPSTYCLNVAVAGSIVMYDRLAKDATT